MSRRRVPREVVERYYPHLSALPLPEIWAAKVSQPPEHDGSGPPVCDPCSADCPACAAERQDGPQ